MTSDSPVKQAAGPTTPTANERTAADLRMRRFLRIGDRTVTHEEAQSSFQTSIVVSALRCTLAYVVLPFVAPLIGVAASVGEPLGVVVSLIALASITFSMRRFFGSDHPKRWHYAAIAGVMVIFLLFLLVTDIVGILT